MSGSFIAVALVALVLIVFWRLTLVVVVAVLIAGFVTGAGIVRDGVAAAEQATTSLVGPGAQPAQATPPR